MNILNFGSLNIDYVYAVDHFVTVGETTGSFSMDRNVGGKGLNQSVAFAKAGATIYHAGCVGTDGSFLTDYLKKVGVHTNYVKVVDVPTGNAIIQVDKTGQNCILLYGGANQAVTEDIPVPCGLVYPQRGGGTGADRQGRRRGYYGGYA